VKTYVLATQNPKKVKELRAIFREAGLGVVGLEDVDSLEPWDEPDEVGTTFAENARIKAAGYARQVVLRGLGPAYAGVIADDSGLEVDALRGLPGVISSHYCTDGREAGMTREERDASNNARVLRELEGIAAEGRGARFVCVMVAAGFDGREIAAARGTFEGRIGAIGEVPRGEGGFGYDPIFLVGPGYERTGAELSAEEKNRLSHRGAAARALAARLGGRTDA